MRRRWHSTEMNFWPGFTDVLSGMLLATVFVLTMFAVTQGGLVSLLHNKDSALVELREQTEKLAALLRQEKLRSLSLESQIERQGAEMLALGQKNRSVQDELRALEDLVGGDRLQVESLLAQLKAYNEQIQALNAKLASAQSDTQFKDASIADLQAALARLRKQLEQMSGTLDQRESQAASQKLRIAELLVQMSKKDDRIAKLELLERYRSEFLEKMTAVFGDNPNIRVVGDRFVFQSEVLFRSGSARLGDGGKDELNRFAKAFVELLPQIPPDLPVNVQVEGHTDNVPIGSAEFRDNWHLSTERALQVVSHLQARGIPKDMLSAAGFGENQPRSKGNNAKARAANRRIEIRITRR